MKFKPLYKFLKSILPLILKTKKILFKEIILFESYPELDGSPWMIYKEMVKRGLNKKYNLIWAVDKTFLNHQKVKCIPFFGKLSRIEKLKRFYYNFFAKVIIDSNRAIKKKSDHTFRIHTRHGGSFKKCTDYMHSVGKTDYILTLSNELQKIDFLDCKDFCVNKIEQILPLGFPIHDRLFENNENLINDFYKKNFKNYYRGKFSKIIGWLPTYRQHRNGNKIDSTQIYPYGIPLIKTENDLIFLNQLLKEYNILLAIQMHHAQMNNFYKKEFSNITLIDQNIKYQLNISTVDLMQSFDALITDYSAAYHEYIMLNRPIALAIDDFEEYSSKTGFLFDYFDWIKGVYLKECSQLFKFVKEIANGIDSTQKERERSIKRIHKYIDNQSTKRVTDFIIEKAKI